MKGSVLAATILSLLLAAPAQAQSSPVTYRGCLQLDPTACTKFTFAMVPSDIGPELWTFWPEQSFWGSVFLYHVLEDFGYSTPDGSCQGTTRLYAFWVPDCAISQRYRVQYTTYVAWFDQNDNFQQHRTPLMYSAVAPEPASILLLASGLVGTGAALGRRRRHDQRH